jgi:hypothetical protein
MNDRKRSFPLHGPCGQIGADAAPVVADARPPIGPSDELVVRNPDQVERPAAEPARAQIVYHGTEQLVREGFVIALRAMGIETDFLPGTLCPPSSPNREDN